jgi:hypothetical protein
VAVPVAESRASGGTARRRPPKQSGGGDLLSGNDDLISKLPDDILGTIISLLSPRTAPRLGPSPAGGVLSGAQRLSTSAHPTGSAATISSASPSSPRSSQTTMARAAASSSTSSASTKLRSRDGSIHGPSLTSRSSTSASYPWTVKMSLRSDDGTRCHCPCSASPPLPLWPESATADFLARLGLL